MRNQPIKAMRADNVNEFDVWIFSSHDLLVSIQPVSAPWEPLIESYEISQPNEN